MLSREFARFLNDERGGYTIWSLVWFIMYVAIGGVAVDITDVFRNQNWLQATADSAALAGVMSVGVAGQDPVKAAQAYARGNMKPGSHGIVLNDTDVLVGTWSFSEERFYSGTADPNAVYVTTRRSTDNGNPVTWSLLRILSIGGVDPWWNVKAEAVAVVGTLECHDEGLIAAVSLNFNPHTNFYDWICLIGHEGFNVAGSGGGGSMPTFDDTVYAGVGCEPSDNCVGPGQNPWNNDDFQNAFGTADGGDGHYNDQTWPSNAENVAQYINTLLQWSNPDHPDYADYASFKDFYETMRKDGIDYSGWEYLVKTGPEDDAEVLSNPAYQEYTAQQFADLTQEQLNENKNKVYRITNCSQGQTFDLPAKEYDRVAIVTDCKLSFDSGTYMITNSLLATMDTSQQAVNGTSNVDVTLGTNCENGVEIYSMGRVHFAAGVDVAGSRILSLGDVDVAAKANGYAGIHIESMGSIDPASGSTSQSNWGLCDGLNNTGPVVLSYALVR